MYEQKKGFLKTYTDEVNLNPNEGTWSWLLHRISGVVLVLYLFAHIIAISASMGGPSKMESWLSALQKPVLHILEIALIGAVAFHLLNGLRITYTDFSYATKSHKGIFWIFMIFFAITVVWTAVLIIGRIGAH